MATHLARFFHPFVCTTAKYVFANMPDVLPCNENFGTGCPWSTGLVREPCIQSLRRKALADLHKLFISHGTGRYRKVEHGTAHAHDASLWAAKADLHILAIETTKFYAEHQLTPIAVS